MAYRIEGGYRAFHATTLSLLRQHPSSIISANSAYRQQLCSTLCVQDPAVVVEGQPSTDLLGSAAAAVFSNVGQVVPAAAAASAPAVAAAPASAATAAEALPQPAPAIVAGGVEFLPGLAMFAHYIAESVETATAAAEQKAAAAARGVAAAKAEAAAAVTKAASEAAAAEAAVAEAAAAATAAAEAKASKGSKDTKGKPAAATKAKELSTAADKGGKAGKKAAADKAATEAAAAAAEPPAAAFEFEFGGVQVPLDRSGAVLCLEDSLPEDAIKQVLQALQKMFLEDMVVFCKEVQSTGHSWAGDKEVAATDELEARLRSHRCFSFPYVLWP